MSNKVNTDLFENVKLSINKHDKSNIVSEINPKLIFEENNQLNLDIMFESMQSNNFNSNSHSNLNVNMMHNNLGVNSMNSVSQRFDATEKTNPQDKSEINSNQLDINELSGTTNLNFNITNE